MYLVEGPVLVREAMDAAVAIEALYAEEPASDDPVVLAAGTAGIPCHLVREGVLAKVLDQRAPRPIVAVARQQLVTADDLVRAAITTQRPVLVAIDLADPGNEGTLIRVAEASGCVGVAVVGQSVDVHNPKTVRASAGSLFRVPVAQVDDVEQLVEVAAAVGVRLVATTGRADDEAVGPVASIDDVDLDGAFALLIGNEAHGLAPDVLARCEHRAAIPMEGTVESLNAAVAGAVVLFEAARRRRARERSSGVHGPLSQNVPRPGTNTEDPPDV